MVPYKSRTENLGRTKQTIFHVLSLTCLVALSLSTESSWAVLEGMLKCSTGRGSGHRFLDPEGVGFGFLSPTQTMWQPGKVSHRGKPGQTHPTHRFIIPLTLLTHIVPVLYKLLARPGFRGSDMCHCRSECRCCLLTMGLLVLWRWGGRCVTVIT